VLAVLALSWQHRGPRPKRFTHFVWLSPEIKMLPRKCILRAASAASRWFAIQYARKAFAPTLPNAPCAAGVQMERRNEHGLRRKERIVDRAIDLVEARFRANSARGHSGKYSTSRMSQRDARTVPAPAVVRLLFDVRCWAMRLCASTMCLASARCN